MAEIRGLPLPPPAPNQNSTSPGFTWKSGTTLGGSNKKTAWGEEATTTTGGSATGQHSFKESGNDSSLDGTTASTALMAMPEAQALVERATQVCAHGGREGGEGGHRS